ncbi:nif-specific transcriptional activator NifA [Gluconacetobacter diazotrophicus]|uniref:Nif-specific regulatory protein n=1 Tax=Gluconacetobacter diazotrophicus (strain ATCC 49037 / DSM 5601 / CCUG 37298 / CIP 103539 / LMG 7603 / PAl5) TaxID=272568 RepID=A9H5T0_GLUDA|nr:nif-specific transcriptional activator NifA [Gluconacetobacter diazotrophicus]CAP54372.1 Nif-specific regulatory protein [Gluconacetobacter diazotrophicus PA1 5]
MPTDTVPFRPVSGEGHSTWAERALFGLHEISKILCAPTETVGIIRNVLAVLESFVDLNNAVVALFDAAGNVETIIGTEADDAAARRYFDSIPEQAVGQIAVSRQPLLVPDVTGDTRYGFATSQAWTVGAGRIGVIGVPILSRDRLVGVMLLDRPAIPEESVVGSMDVCLLSMVAGLMGQMVRLHRLVQRDRENLLHDSGLAQPAPPVADGGGYMGIVGDSPALRAVLQKVEIVARSDVTVLLRGESGTGKELFAQAIHQASPRHRKPFVKLNCAALPESVLESELFGHEKGAFTGAIGQRKGRFELADGGTLFMDEIGEISPSFQAKLLRVLQEGEFERVGGTRTLKVDVRVVTATNRNLEEAVSKGRFRADLYYRLSVIPIFLPPLRDRPTDIPMLANEFLRRFNETNRTSLTIASDGMDVLTTCYFPGNVRELENCIRRTATLAPGQTIGAADFACRSDGCLSSIFWRPAAPAPGPGRHPAASDVAGDTGAATELPVLPAPRSSSQSSPQSSAAPDPATCPSSAVCSAAQGEWSPQRDELLEAMETAGWVQAKAARILGLTPRQIGYALRKNGISIKKF